jgi:hypothetical protein
MPHSPTRPDALQLAAATALDTFDARTTALGDPRPHPPEAALVQLGEALMTELLDLVLGGALEDHAEVICEALLSGLHVGVQRLDREAERARDRLGELLRGFDGGEVADTEIQAVRDEAERADVAATALAFARDAAARTYGAATGEAWSPWRSGGRPVRLSAAVIEAREAIRAARARRQAAADPGGPVVAFRGAPAADTALDAMRIFDALNWARGAWPDMALALTGAPGAERLARSWARQKGVRLVLARPDFERHGRAAPFRANDELLALEPVCVLLLSRSLSAERPGRPFGPVLSLAEAARGQGLRCLRIGPSRGAEPGLTG